MSKIQKIKKVVNDHKIVSGVLLGITGTCAVVFAISHWPVKLDGYADFATKRVTDEDVFKEVCSRTNFISRLNPRKVCGESLWSFADISQ